MLQKMSNLIFYTKTLKCSNNLPKYKKRAERRTVNSFIEKSAPPQLQYSFCFLTFYYSHGIQSMSST